MFRIKKTMSNSLCSLVIATSCLDSHLLMDCLDIFQVTRSYLVMHVYGLSPYNIYNYIHCYSVLEQIGFNCTLNPIGGETYANFLRQLADGTVPINSRLYDIYIPTPNPLNMVGNKLYYFDALYGSFVNGEFNIYVKGLKTLMETMQLGDWGPALLNQISEMERICDAILQSKDTTVSLQNRYLAIQNQQTMEGMGAQTFAHIKELLRAYDPRFILEDSQLSLRNLKLLNNATYGVLEYLRTTYDINFTELQQAMLNTGEVDSLVRMLLKSLSRRLIIQVKIIQVIEGFFEDPSVLNRILKDAENITFPEIGKTSRLNPDTSALVSTPKLNQLNYPEEFGVENKPQQLALTLKRLAFTKTPSPLRTSNSTSSQEVVNYWDID